LAVAESGRLSLAGLEGAGLSLSEIVSVRVMLTRAYAIELPKTADRIIEMFA
jgi:hypothetical protein